MQRNEQMYQHCLQHIGRHVKADMADQQSFYGFVENVDAENVYLIMLESDGGGHGFDNYSGSYGHGSGHQAYGTQQLGHHPGNDHYYTHGQQQAYGPPHGHQHHGYGHQDGHWGQPQMDQRVFGGYGYGYPGYGYGGYGAPGFRWRRLALPLAGLAAISLLF
ncbi:hypothetical protein [Salicibibacter kimchii]|uniref:Uncharacterized protein n=1 Tax=Salicibibacter kimchii TaxID=2099786 RepID=A0A345C3D3_9BACI|nr:hypothetical protein [Salicibibacter kimchii]AXF57714.1 hypothetical protein DT065_18220 [Salicibibacter kimchii]